MTRSEHFASLAIQMMDLSIDKKLSTSTIIPGIMNQMGWNARQVLQVWSVSPTISVGQEWDEKSLETLGGKNICSMIWNKLKDCELTGNSKRSAPDSFHASKRVKLSDVNVSDETSLAESPNACLASPLPNTNSFHADFNASPCLGERRRSKAKRRMLEDKITHWLLPKPSFIPAEPHPSIPPPSSSSQKKASRSKTTQGSSPATPAPSEKIRRGRKSARFKLSIPSSQPILTFLSAKEGRQDEKEAARESTPSKEVPKKPACPILNGPIPSDPTHTLPASPAMPATPAVRQKKRRGRKTSCRKQDPSSSHATTEAPVAVQRSSQASQPSSSTVMDVHATLKQPSIASYRSTPAKPNLKQTGNSSLGENTPSKKQQEEALL